MKAVPLTSRGTHHRHQANLWLCCPTVVNRALHREYKPAAASAELYTFAHQFMGSLSSCCKRGASHCCSAAALLSPLSLP